MPAILRMWWPLLLAFLLLQTGNGLQSTLIGVRAEWAQFGSFLTGIVMSLFYVGYTVGSLVAPRIIGHTSHVKAFAGFTALAAASIAFYGAAVDALLWCALRLILGFALAGIYVTAASWLNDRTGNDNRGRVFSLYITAQLIGLMVGQLALIGLSSGGGFAQALCVALVGLTILPIVFGNAPEATKELPERLPFMDLYAQSPLSVIGCVVAGLLWAAVMAIAPIYGIRAGLSQAGAAMLFGSAVGGGLLMQFPVGWLSDHADRRLVMAGTAGLAAIIALIGIFAGATVPAVLFIVMVLFGGLTFPFYTLAVSHMNDRVKAVQRLSASGTMEFLFGLGSIFGPVLAMLSMAAMGAWGYFLLLAVVCAGFTAYIVLRMVVKPKESASSA